MSAASRRCSHCGVRLSILASVAAPWLVVSACSVSPARPPELGACDVGDASCPVSVISGGTQGGEGEGGTGPIACPVSAGDSQCDQCVDAKCCQPFATCNDSLDCGNLLRCEQQTCTGALDCVANCEMQSPKGVALLNSLTTCIEARCPVCSQLGIGDPCTPFGVACNPGLVCNGFWCSKACTRSTDCVGLGVGGGNTLGLPNACIVTATVGEECQPGCNQDSDCSEFPGSFCFVTTSAVGTSVSFCTPPPRCRRRLNPTPPEMVSLALTSFRKF